MCNFYSLTKGQAAIRGWFRNFNLVVTRQDDMTRGSADQSPRDGGDVRN
jgi:hypothetical protein